MNHPRASAFLLWFSRPIGLLLMLIVWGLAALFFIQQPSIAADKKPASEKSANTDVAITSAKVKLQSLPLFMEGVGTVAANASVTIRSRVDGVLTRVDFTEGQEVRAGQRLAQIDDRALRAQWAQAEAQLAKDRALLANAQLDAKRNATLMQDNAISQQALDSQRALVAQLSAQVQSDLAQVNIAKVQWDYTKISSPISGRTGALLVSAGNLIRANDANGLVVVNQLDPIVVQFSLPADAVPHLVAAQQRQAKIQALVYAQNDDTLTTPLGTGTLILLNNQIDVNTGAVMLKARFTNREHRLWPGQFVQIKLIYGERENALTLPETAIQNGSAGAFVYEVNADNKVQATPVTLIGKQDGLAVMASGVKAGARVVIGGQYKLRPGVSVKEHEAANQENPKAAATQKH